MVMQDLKENVGRLLNMSLYYRYVDDILIMAKEEEVDKIFDVFNSYHYRLKFTIEFENNRSINFLDLSLIVVDNRLTIDWFHKNTFSGRYLSFYSNHPNCMKRGIVYGLVDRAILLSHPPFFNKNICLCIDMLIENGYPLDYIFNNINVRIKSSIERYKVASDGGEVSLNNNKNLENKIKKHLVIPFIKGISGRVGGIFDKSDTLMGYRTLNGLDKFIKVQKDITSKNCKSHVVYKINCKDCDSTYVGQTKRQLQTRIKEHKNNLRMDSSKHSVISQHIMEYDHRFDWENIDIMDVEHNYKRRLISEMLHIKEQPKGLNYMRDTELLSESYTSILNEISTLKYSRF
ncbi:hypothetical protein ALC62_02852 [Cyphomyrmex costatus]|uniref:GIY-YIG domain-containing protein n=1 Tax=Cyphomyrmex costatus TaxID=456900 RepID=A0A151IMM7_9HYME|nr:hypothetical protein ALC62_02852 [Cyphomyrmex costatus]